MLNFKNTARLAIAAGLCASIALPGVPAMAAVTDGVQLETVDASALADGTKLDEGLSVAEAPDTAGYVEDAEGNVSISSAEGLAKLAEVVNAGTNFQGKTVTLTADIDLANQEWTPIGKQGSAFKGIFDGRGHTVSNLKISGSVDTSGANAYRGLFGWTENGELKNFTLHNANVTGGIGVGAIVGCPYTSDMTGLNLTGDVSVNGYAYVGGMFGRNAYGNLTDLTVNVTAGSKVVANSGDSMTYVGGVVGFMGEGSQVVSNVISNISVYGSTAGIGGISGNIHYGNTFKGCSVAAGVQVSCTAANPKYHPFDTMQTGGIVGLWVNAGNTPSTIEDCSFGGALSSTGRDGSDYSDLIAGNAFTGGSKSDPSSNGASGQLNIIEDGTTTIVPGGEAALKGIFENIKDGDCIKLAADATCGGIVIPEGVAATIDLNGHTLNTTTGQIVVKTGANLILTGDGVLTNDMTGNQPENYAIYTEGGSTTTFDGIKVDAACGLYAMGDASVNRANFDISGACGIAVTGSAKVTVGDPNLSEEENNANVVVTSANNCISTSAAGGKTDSVCTVYGGTFTGGTNPENPGNPWNSGPVYWASHGTLDVKGGVFTTDADTCAVFQKNGTVNISGGTFKGKDGFKIDATAGDTTEIKTEISGGTFEGDRAGFYANAGVGKIDYANNYNVKITGGDFSGGSEGALHVKGAESGVEAAGKQPAVISGGTFDELVPSNMLADGFGINELPEGGYGVHEHEWGNEYVSDGDGHAAKCTKCDEYGQKVAHDKVTEGKKDPTCGEPGYTGDVVCSDCGYVFEDEKGEKIPATGKHSFTDEWEKDSASHWRKCTVCGAKEETGAHVADAWKSNGSHHWKTCDVCGADFSIADHDFGAWKVTKKATDTEAGMRERSCKTCGEVVSEEIPALKDHLPQTSDDSMLPIVAAGVAGVVAVAAGVAIVMKRRK